MVETVVVEKGEITLDERLLKEWDYEKNSGISPENISIGSEKKVWWKCSLGHSWKTTFSKRSQRGYGCPYCSNQKVLEGFNDLVTTNPKLIVEWDYDKNSIQPTEVVAGSGKKVWWKCSLGHSWNAEIRSRAKNNTGCPYCSNNKVLAGFNDLSSRYPMIADEWDYDKNVGLKPSEFLYASDKKVFWKCSKGHSWVTSIRKRTERKSGCPFCCEHHQKIAVGYNDLATTNPDLLEEWDYDKNVDVMPQEITAGSGIKVWWKCRLGHSWQGIVYNRAKKGDRCPDCYSKTSFSEQAVLYYLKKYISERVVNREKIAYQGKSYEIDVLIPTLSTGVEFDGYYWHKNKLDYDKDKDIAITNLGIKLFHICEGIANEIVGRNITFDYKHQYKKNLAWAITMLLDNLKINHDVIDVIKDSSTINEQWKFLELEKSLETLYPDIAKDWDYEKNGQLKPSSFAPNSNMSVWWICTKGHHYYSVIANRVRMNAGCPYCSNQKILKGFNDLETLRPDLAEQWDYEKNEEVPCNVSIGSGIEYWWKCKLGHSWKDTVCHRKSGRNCPYCSGHRVLKDFNDLKTKRPDVVKVWDYEKNNIDPSEIYYRSRTKFWWKCQHGHEWFDSVMKWSSVQYICPICYKSRKYR